MSKKEGIENARKIGLDLVEISSHSIIPVCKIIDYNKYKYNLIRKINVGKKKSRSPSIKEIKLKPNIEQFDFMVKLKKAQNFIKKLKKIKVSLIFKGRSKKHEIIGNKTLEGFKNQMSSLSIVESDIKKDGKSIYIILSPKIY